MPYTTKQEAILKAAATPITYANAGELADLIGKSRGSIISKVLSLEIPYECKPKAAKRAKGPTKIELVAAIADYIGTSAEALSGLDKATAAALGNLIVATTRTLGPTA